MRCCGRGPDSLSTNAGREKQRSNWRTSGDDPLSPMCCRQSRARCDCGGQRAVIRRPRGAGRVLLGVGAFGRRGEGFEVLLRSSVGSRSRHVGPTFSVRRGKMAPNWPLRWIDVRKSNWRFILLSLRGSQFSGQAVYLLTRIVFGGDGVEGGKSRAGEGRLGEGYCVLMSTRLTAEKILLAPAQHAQHAS